MKKVKETNPVWSFQLENGRLYYGGYPIETLGGGRKAFSVYMGEDVHMCAEDAIYITLQSPLYKVEPKDHWDNWTPWFPVHELGLQFELQENRWVLVSDSFEMPLYKFVSTLDNKEKRVLAQAFAKRGIFLSRAYAKSARIIRGSKRRG